MIGSHAAFWSLGGARVRIRSGPGRMHELAGLTAAVGEQLGLACAADHEVDSWLALKAPRQADTAVQREMSTRAMLELETHFLLGIGHALANLVARVVVLDPALSNQVKTRLKTDMPPDSNKRSDWVTMHQAAAKLPGIVNGVDDLAPLVAALVTLRATEAWSGIEDLRGEDFHRWRPQSAGIVSTARGSLYRPAKDGTFVIDGHDGLRLGIDVPIRTAVSTAAGTADALVALHGTLVEIEDAFRVPLERMTGLRFNREREEVEARLAGEPGGDVS